MAVNRSTQKWSRRIGGSIGYFMDRARVYVASAGGGGGLAWLTGSGQMNNCPVTISTQLGGHNISFNYGQRYKFNACLYAK